MQRKGPSLNASEPRDLPRAFGVLRTYSRNLGGTSGRLLAQKKTLTIYIWLTLPRGLKILSKLKSLQFELRIHLEKFIVQPCSSE